VIYASNLNFTCSLQAIFSWLIQRNSIGSNEKREALVGGADAPTRLMFLLDVFITTKYLLCGTMQVRGE
jgi:hypothetical protein